MLVWFVSTIRSAIRRRLKPSILPWNNSAPHVALFLISEMYQAEAIAPWRWVLWGGLCRRCSPISGTESLAMVSQTLRETGSRWQLLGGPSPTRLPLWSLWTTGRAAWVRGWLLVSMRCTGLLSSGQRWHILQAL